MISYFEDEVNEVKQKYGSSVNGIYIRNPGRNGFSTEFYSDVFELITENGFKVGIDGYGNHFNAEIASVTHCSFLRRH